MIIFLYGLDTYRSSKKLNEIVEHYKEINKSGLNLKYLDLEEKDYEDLREITQSASMFIEKKLIILKNTSSNKEFQTNFFKNIEEIDKSKDIIVLYEEGEAPKDKFFKKIQKLSQSQEFNPLENQQLRNWTKKEINRLGTNIRDGALDKLINFVDNDLWQMENEIKKLVAFKIKDDNSEISDKDVELLVKPKIETDIFETIDAIASRDKKRALQFLKDHLEEGDSPFYLLSMINFQFRNILIIKDLTEKGLSPYNLKGVHPYAIRKGLSLSRRFNLAELKTIYKKLFEVDLALKTGKIDPETALDLLITEL